MVAASYALLLIAGLLCQCTWGRELRLRRGLQRRQGDSSDGGNPDEALVLTTDSGSDSFAIGGNSTLNDTNWEFSAGKWLGYGLNMFQVMPFDIDTIDESTARAARIIELGGKGQIYTFPDGKSDWVLPKNVHCGGESTSVEGQLRTFASGDKAASEFSTKASFAARYEVVSASGGAKLGVKNVFSNELQYAMWSYRDHTLTCDINNYLQHVMRDNVRNALAVTRWKPWDPNDEMVKSYYRSFFALYGTHIITSTRHGSSASVSSWASNHNEKVNEFFQADVTAAFEGLVSSGKVDVKVKQSDQYASFKKSFQSIVYCRGGDPLLAAQIEAGAQAEGSWDKFKKWQKSAASNPPLTGIDTIAWSDLMNGMVQDKKVMDFATNIATAFKWISENPQTHRTRCRMIVDSDWGEVALFSPSAFIERDESKSAYPPGVQTASTKFGWYSPDGEPKATMTFDFFIINGGENIDIELSHGRDGPRGPEKGEITVYVYENQHFTNKEEPPKRVSNVVVNPIGKDEAMPPRQIPYESSGANMTVSSSGVYNSSYLQDVTFSRE